MEAHEETDDEVAGYHVSVEARWSVEDDVLFDQWTGACRGRHPATATSR
jgi:hypothetical protein